MREILLDYRRENLSRPFILRDPHFLRVPRIGFVGERVCRIDLAGVDIGNGNATGFGGCRAVGLGARVCHHDCLVEIFVEIFMLFLPSQPNPGTNRGEAACTSVMLVSNLVWKPNSEVLYTTAESRKSKVVNLREQNESIPVSVCTGSRTRSPVFTSIILPNLASI